MRGDSHPKFCLGGSSHPRYGLPLGDADLEAVGQLPADVVLGVCFCYALPALDKQLNPPEFTEAAGSTRWYLYDLARNTILDEPGQIAASIRCTPDTPRKCTMQKPTLVELRAKIEKHIKNNYLKRIDAPVGVKPALKCWMELNEG